MVGCGIFLVLLFEVDVNIGEMIFVFFFVYVVLIIDLIVDDEIGEVEV